MRKGGGEGKRREGRGEGKVMYMRFGYRVPVAWGKGGGEEQRRGRGRKILAEHRKMGWFVGEGERR